MRSRIAGRPWYHTIELAPDVVTPGWFDCRPVATRVLPASCEGLRCLDVGTFDGVWAFEMERRGALGRAALATRRGRELLFAGRLGEPHACAIARPR